MRIMVTAQVDWTYNRDGSITLTMTNYKTEPHTTESRHYKNYRGAKLGESLFFKRIDKIKLTQEQDSIPLHTPLDDDWGVDSIEIEED